MHVFASVAVVEARVPTKPFCLPSPKGDALSAIFLITMTVCFGLVTVLSLAHVCSSLGELSMIPFNNPCVLMIKFLNLTLLS